jgi:hypothetical protein
MDSWLFYLLIRAKYLPPLPTSHSIFPEFRGLAMVGDNGQIKFNYLTVDRNSHWIHEINSKDESNSNQRSSNRSKSSKNRLMKVLLETHHLINPMEKIRYGLPQWAPWKTPAEEGSSVKSRDDILYNLFDILTNFVQITAEYFVPNYPDQYKEKLRNSIVGTNPSFGLQVMRLEFHSETEARNRAAMLMLATYEARSGRCLTFLTEDQVKRRSVIIFALITTRSNVIIIA